MKCIKCGKEVVKAGRKNNKQRYRCSKCAKNRDKDYSFTLDDRRRGGIRGRSIKYNKEMKEDIPKLLRERKDYLIEINKELFMERKEIYQKWKNGKSEENKERLLRETFKKIGIYRTKINRNKKKKTLFELVIESLKQKYNKTPSLSYFYKYYKKV